MSSQVDFTVVIILYDNDRFYQELKDTMEESDWESAYGSVLSQ